MDPGEAEPGYGSEVPDSFSQSDFGLIPDQPIPGSNAPSQPKIPALGLPGFSKGSIGQDAKGAQAAPGGLGGLGL